ncbi:hypothetical protein [Bacillus paranthracis]|uniref:hypothetical protein n=1 Tax=Bacillus paranthracis TaxID=2026186 RepID=UPI003D64D71F
MTTTDKWVIDPKIKKGGITIMTTLIEAIHATEDETLYTKESIVKILEAYFFFQEAELTDSKLMQAKADIDRALECDQLDSDMRVALACTHALELTMMQACQLSGIKVKDFREALQDGYEVIEAVMNGYKAKKLRTSSSKATDYEDYLKEIQDGSISMFDITDEVTDSLVHFLARKGDALSKHKLGHDTTKPRHEARAYVEFEEDEGEEYPFHVTCNAIEDPMRKYDYVDWKASGFDYFRDQDRNRKMILSSDLRIHEYSPKKDGNSKKVTTNKEEI